MVRSAEIKDKPTYRVPLMAEIGNIPWNGFNVVSTFSGCGGSCLGFEMAGFKVLWANEFIPAAQEVYRLNHPNTILDTKDIRTITPEDILKAIGLCKGEIDVLEGSPPCASFSVAGRGKAHWGKVKTYSDTKQRTDDLFYEYIRLLDSLQPRVFVAENVPGLVKGAAKGYFKRILSAMRHCGYNVQCKILDAAWLGVPQSRQRTIFIGVRDDLGQPPVFPKPWSFQYTVSDAIPGITRYELANGSDSIGSGEGHTYTDAIDRPMRTIQQGRAVNIELAGYAIGAEWDRMQPGQQSDKYFNLVKPSLDKPSPTITQLGGNLSVASVVHPTEKRKFTITELKRICAFPDDFQLTGSYSQQWERLGRAVPPLMMYEIAKTISEEIL